MLSFQNSLSLFALAMFSAVASAAVLPSDLKQIATNAHCLGAELLLNATVVVGGNIVTVASLSCAPASDLAARSIASTILERSGAPRGLLGALEQTRDVAIGDSTRREVMHLEKRHWSIWNLWPLCILLHTKCFIPPPPPPHYPPPPPPPKTTSKPVTSAPTSVPTSAPSSVPSSSPTSATPTPTPSSIPPVHVCGAACTTTCNNDAGVLPPISEDCQVLINAVEIFNDQGPTSFVVDPNHLETITFGTCSFWFSNFGTQQLEYCWTDLSKTAQAAGATCFPPVQPFTSEALCTSADGLWAVGAAHS